ncbi:hypothetical protein [Spirulina major]|uniref:hypothetical protein n=1 Tax=Spirulina major TaxID=270636 RepID=UPI00158709B7|nr:hypothetical protein [Spirulina major]
MGRNAKRKKQRQSDPPKPSHPDQFVNHLEHRGYDYRDIQRSPNLPQTDRQPEV